MTKLSDVEIDGLHRFVIGDDGPRPIHMVWIDRALTELRERRAADLTAEDREALTFAKERVSFNLNANAASEYFSDAYADRYRHAIAVLSKLLDGGREGK